MNFKACAKNWMRWIGIIGSTLPRIMWRNGGIPFDVSWECKFQKIIQGNRISQQRHYIKKMLFIGNISSFFGNMIGFRHCHLCSINSQLDRKNACSLGTSKGKFWPSKQLSWMSFQLICLFGRRMAVYAFSFNPGYDFGIMLLCNIVLNLLIVQWLFTQ